MVGQPSDTFCIFYVFYCILLYFICIFYILLISFIFFDVALMRDTMPAHNNKEQPIVFIASLSLLCHVLAGENPLKSGHNWAAPSVSKSFATITIKNDQD